MRLGVGASTSLRSRLQGAADLSCNESDTFPTGGLQVVLPENAVRLWKVTNGELLNTPKGHGGLVSVSLSDRTGACWHQEASTERSACGV